MTCAADATPPFYHGTRADLAVGDLLTPGFRSNFANRKLSWIYFAATLEAAIWGAELARGEGRERIYIVEPTGPFEDDPNDTNKRFPGNVTQSYRTRDPMRSVGEVEHSAGAVAPRSLVFAFHPHQDVFTVPADSP